VTEQPRNKSSIRRRIIFEAEMFEFELPKAHLQVLEFFKYNQLLYALETTITLMVIVIIK
jgi:hypothetical protein